ncbi:MAG TPA: acyloxyacyl hydrolase [Steroidobacteraceae bacterium]|nr:acyloxyacyl hydrolase [Steroidobacteraceae bacterium]
MLPIMLDFADGRWELGAFRFATSQRFAEASLPFATLDAHPYWGFSGAHRWNVWNPDWGKVFLGFGAAYRSKTDYIEATHWNFAYQVGMRFNLGRRGELLEFSIRHWSNAWVKLPNRGQNFATLSFAF